jgi:hypothetical protein
MAELVEVMTDRYSTVEGRASWFGNSDVPGLEYGTTAIFGAVFLHVAHATNNAAVRPVDTTLYLCPLDKLLVLNERLFLDQCLILVRHHLSSL